MTRRLKQVPPKVDQKAQIKMEQKEQMKVKWKEQMKVKLVGLKLVGSLNYCEGDC